MGSLTTGRRDSAGALPLVPLSTHPDGMRLRELHHLGWLRTAFFTG